MRARSVHALITLACASPLAAQVFAIELARPLPIHSQARINDPRSHGQVGDQYLSLREAILLTNRQLDENSLSPAEFAQLGGFGTDIAWADIDARVVPVITLEAELPLILDSSHGFTLNGSNGIPTLELGDTRGLVAESNFVDFSNLHLHGGERGISITQTDTLFGSLVSNVEFDGQGISGLQLASLTPNAAGRLQVNNCRFRGLPTAMLVLEAGSGRTSQLEIFGDTWMEACGIGLDLRLGSGGSQTLYLNGVVSRGCTEAFRVLALAAPRRSLAIDARYCGLVGTGSGMTIQGSPVGNTLATLQACELGGSPALDIGPLGSRADITLQDSRVHGDLFFHGGATGKLVVDNCDVDGGHADLGSTGAPLTIANSVFAQVDIATLGTIGVTFRDSRAIGGTFSGSASATLTVQDSHLAGTTVGAGVTVLRPLSAAPLGTFDAQPAEPPLGTTLTVGVDLPPNLAAVIAFGRTLEYGTTVSGLRFYADSGSLVFLPGSYAGQSSLPLPIPNLAALRNLDLFFQPIVLAQPGSGLPTRALPPGRRVRLR
ncbi:MAG: hypothetical protein U1F36_21555 [Planctomycetota bacterium]